MKKAPSGYVSSWALAWRGQGGGWPHLIRIVAGAPDRVREVREQCTYAEVAAYYKSVKAEDGEFTWNER